MAGRFEYQTGILWLARLQFSNFDWIHRTVIIRSRNPLHKLLHLHFAFAHCFLIRTSTGVSSVKGDKSCTWCATTSEQLPFFFFCFFKLPHLFKAMSSHPRYHRRTLCQSNWPLPNNVKGDRDYESLKSVPSINFLFRLSPPSQEGAWCRTVPA